MDTNFEKPWGAGAVLVMVLILFHPGWAQAWWANFIGRPGFTFLPLSSFDLGMWLLSFIGLLIYVTAYVAFQEWRTNGTWLTEMRKRVLAHDVADNKGVEPINKGARKPRRRAQSEK
jgi:hypothetical protein